jgi:hypothetical protein
VSQRVIDSMASPQTSPSDAEFEQEQKRLNQLLSTSELLELDGSPVELIKNDKYQRTKNALSGNIMIDTIHCGSCVPKTFYHHFSRDDRRRLFAKEKDWGADHLALCIAKNLNITGYHKVHLARALMDFGRLPGSTPPDSQKRHPMHRLSINYPFTEELTYAEQRSLLEDYYDPISAYVEEEVSKSIIRIGVHTYDRYNIGPTPEEAAGSFSANHEFPSMNSRSRLRALA